MYKLDVKTLQHVDKNHYKLTTAKVYEWSIFQDKEDQNLYFCFNGEYKNYNDLSYFYVVDEKSIKIMLYEKIVSKNKDDRIQLLKNFKDRSIKYHQAIIKNMESEF